MTEQDSGEYFTDLREGRKIPITHTGREGGMGSSRQTTDESFLSPALKGRMKRFENITQRIVDEQTHLDCDQPHKMVYGEKTQNPEDQPGITITQDVVDVWSRTAQNMYDGISSNPAAKAAADEIIRKAKDEPEEILSQEQIEALLEREAF